MNLSRGTLANLCLGWAFALLLGVTMGLNIPFILMIGWSLLLIVG